MTSVPAVRSRSLLVVLLCTAGGSIVTGTPAAADCSGPQLAFEPTEVPRGGEVEVVGTGFGDNCYDTGPPPAGEGVLGVPQLDVEVLVVQGDEEILVAKGDADDGYRFEVTVVVPVALAPGPARLVARFGDGGEAFVPQEAGLVVTDAPPVDGADGSVVRFGGTDPEPVDEAEPAGEEAEAAEDDSSGNPLLPVVGVLLVLAAVAACVLYPRRKLRPRPPTS